MVKITADEDCGNAPKKLFLKNFIVAIVTNATTYITGNAIDDIRWNIVGGESINGIQAVLAALKRYRSDDVVELVINTIVTHGYNGVVEGVLKFKNRAVVAFCDVYEFRASTNNAPIKALTTYSIPLKQV